MDFGIRILVADDFELARVLVKNALLGLGFKEVSDARDGKDALEQLRSAKAEGRPYSCLLTDINMPRMDGFKLISSCRGDPDFKDLPIIVVSAEGAAQVITEAIQGGASDFVVKPLVPEVLMKKLTRVLDSPGR